MVDETTPPERPKRKPPNRLTPRPSRAKAVKSKPGPKPKPKPEPAPKPVKPEATIGPTESEAMKALPPPSKEKAGRGRPGHTPDVISRRVVETHAATNTSHFLIAGFLGISVKTLERHYSEELQWGRPRLIARLGALVAQAALKGCKTRQIFLLRTLGGPQWRPGSDLHHSGPNGEPLIPKEELVIVSTETLTIEEIRTMRTIQRKITAATLASPDAD